MIRTIRRAAFLAVAVILAAGAAGCSQQPQLHGYCGVVVDGSQSGNQTTGFDASAQLSAHLKGFLASTGCRFAVFAPIDGASQSSVCSQPKLDMDPPAQGNVDVPALIQQGYKAALQMAGKELACAQTDPRSVPGASDVVGGLAQIAGELPPGQGPYNVLVVSDFINWDSDLRLPNKDLSTAGGRTALVSKLANEGLVPDLHGVHVYAAGFGMLVSKNPQVFPEFRAFWQQFMTRAHAASFQPNQ